MKRSPLKRKTPMKRTCTKSPARKMRPTRATRPLKKFRALLRKLQREPKHQCKKFRDSYKRINFRDEWYERLNWGPYDGKVISIDDPRLFQPLELNHIFTNPRRDVTPCVITLSKINHDWFHEHINAGRLLCLVVKIRKGEADLELWNKAYGKNVATLTDHPECMTPSMLRFRDEFLCWLVTQQREAA